MSVRHPSAGASGQHFLRSSDLAAAFVADAAVSRGALVVEIGGGTGVITHALADAGAELIVVERDAKLVQQLETRFRNASHVQIVAGDAVTFRWPARDFSVVANLPFARSGAILGHLLDDPQVPLVRADVIVQWELAAKHTAVWPSTLRSNYWRAWFDLGISRRLARTAFAPVPSVDAAVLRFGRRPEPWVDPERHDAYRHFLTTAFDSGLPLRRALDHALSPRQLKRLAPRLGFAVDCRPWDLDADQWARLYAAADRAK